MKPNARERHHRMEAKRARRAARKRCGGSIVQAQHSVAAGAVVDNYQRAQRRRQAAPVIPFAERTERRSWWRKMLRRAA